MDINSEDFMDWSKNDKTRKRSDIWKPEIVLECGKHRQFRVDIREKQFRVIAKKPDKSRETIERRLSACD